MKFIKQGNGYCAFIGSDKVEILPCFGGWQVFFNYRDIEWFAPGCLGDAKRFAKARYSV